MSAASGAPQEKSAARCLVAASASMADGCRPSELPIFPQATRSPPGADPSAARNSPHNIAAPEADARPVVCQEAASVPYPPLLAEYHRRRRTGPSLPLLSLRGRRCSAPLRSVDQAPGAKSRTERSEANYSASSSRPPTRPPRKRMPALAPPALAPEPNSAAACFALTPRREDLPTAAPEFNAACLALMPRRSRPAPGDGGANIRLLLANFFIQSVFPFFWVITDQMLMMGFNSLSTFVFSVMFSLENQNC
nr:uncharacterized protein LOC127338613 [Lolium perenne]